jgi:hypothetical protein
VLCELLGVAEARLATVQNEWIDAAVAGGRLQREPQWSEALAVGSRTFVDGVQAALDSRARYRHVQDAPGFSMLRETKPAYKAHFRAEIVSVSATDGLDVTES